MVIIDFTKKKKEYEQEGSFYLENKVFTLFFKTENPIDPK